MFSRWTCFQYFYLLTCSSRQAVDPGGRLRVFLVHSERRVGPIWSASGLHLSYRNSSGESPMATWRTSWSRRSEFGFRMRVGRVADRVHGFFFLDFRVNAAFSTFGIQPGATMTKYHSRSVGPMTRVTDILWFY